MAFDFETRIDRRGTGAAKWNSQLAAHGQPAPGAAWLDGGPEPIPLSVADMELAAPPVVLEAMKARIDHGIFGYTMIGQDYRSAACAWQRERHGWDMPGEAILTFQGVLPALCLAIRGLVAPGAKVLLQTPAFPPFVDAVTRSGAVVATDPLVLGDDGRYRMDMAGLERALADPEVAMFVLCNPHNPVGRAWDAQELEAVAQLCARHDVLVFADEIHGDLTMPGQRFTPFASLGAQAAPRTIVANGLSKTMNLAGLHLCNIVVPDAGLRERVEALAYAAGHFGVNPVSMAGFIAGWREGGPWLDALMEHIAGNRAHMVDFLAERLPRIAAKPMEATYLAWLDLRGLGLEPEAIVALLVERARVRLENGAAFGEGGAGFFRVNLACPRSMLAEALERIAGALGSNR
ncbi:MAG: PatB family C-S lyase [Proteobacteria bacterium]|nr:PatB family C-S lyase [Pseudomonadota bacterium]MDA0951615.1 PatB family C-S lyase [Pseudomonadota bacterium]MDA1070469.1 PatB family C-S lyase [Pseudomonadota bacterium]